MPLNLSTKPTNPYNSNNNSANTTPTILNSRSNSIIWSPASMCEQEKSIDTGMHTDLQQSIENLENRNNFIKHYNNLKNLTLLQQSARNEFNYGKIDKGYFTHLQQKVKEQIISESNNNRSSSGINGKRGENRANNDNINNNRNMNNKNTMFMLNNNNVIMVGNNGNNIDKELARPDSTAHNIKHHSEETTGRRKERNFQVSTFI